jgi:hypothetical protein
MKPISRAIAAIALIAGLNPAFSQVPNFPQTMPSDTFVGRIQPGSGPSSAIPIQSLLSRVVPPNSLPNSSLAKVPAATLKGNPTASTGNVQDFTIQGLPNRGAPDANNDKILIFDSAAGVFKYVLSGAIAAAATSGVASIDGATNALTLQLGSLKVIGSQISSNVLSSRAFAKTQNLSSFSAIQTQGYATPGDGGGAMFLKLAAGVQFQDTYVVTATLVGGSGYPNGTYTGVVLSGASSFNCSVQAVVSGGAVTSVSMAVPCAGYKVGDVLTTPNFFLGNAGGSGFSWTITSTSTAQASFTDSVGTNFQFVTDQAGFANILQFGAKGDWFGVDGSATNNSPAIWSALSWAAIANGASLAQVNGNFVLVPKGAYMTCGGGWNGTIYEIPISQGVHFSGVGVGGTTLVGCAAGANSLHYVELCDANSKVGQYGCKIENMTINLQNVPGSTGGFAAIYSNSGQQDALGEHLEIQPGLRSCIIYEIGKGGAANDIWIGVDCEQSAGATNPGLVFNSSSTQHVFRNGGVGCGGAGGCALAIQNLAGRLIVDSIDIEAYVTGLQQNVSIGGDNSVYRNVQQNSNNCSQAISLQPTNVPGNILFENVSSSCPIIINNGQSGGANFMTRIRGPLMCISGACAAAVP